MPDFTPDTSIYRPQNQMDAGSMLNLIQTLRNLNTQSGIAAALRANPNDAAAAGAAATRDPSVTMGTEQAAGFVNLQRQQFELHQRYMGEAASAISSLLSNTDSNGNLRATLSDWHRISPMLRGYGIPQSYIDAVEKSASSGGRLDKDRLLDVASYATGGKGLPTVQRNIGGIQQEVSPIAIQRPGFSQQAASPQAAPSMLQPGKPQYEDTAWTAARDVVAQQPKYPAGTTEASNLNSHYKLGTDLYNAHTAEAGNYQANAKPFTEMIRLMREGDDGTTGRGLEALNNVKNALYTFGIFSPQDKAGIANVSRFEQLRKYMVQAVQSGTLGSTDARMVEGIMGSPNVDLLTQSNMKLAQVMLGMMRRNTIAKSEFDRTGIGNLNPGLYGDWRADWEKRQDTAGFVWDQMTKDERAAYRKAHPGQDSAIGSSWQAARRSGVSPKLEGEQ